MPHDPRKLLYDVVEACAAITSFCRGRTRAEYLDEMLLRSACERQFEIIGEALTRLRNRHALVFEQIPEGRAVIGFRNRLIHGYDTVDALIVWEVIEDRIPLLHRATAQLLHDIDMRF